MKRLEIFANRSVQEDLLEALHEAALAEYYSLIPLVHGVGKKGPRMGDSVWPEENFSLVIWCDSEEALLVAEVVKGIKGRFPDEGIRLFGLD